MNKKRKECDGCPFWDETKEFCFFFQGGCLWEDDSAEEAQKEIRA